MKWRSQEISLEYSEKKDYAFFLYCDVQRLVLVGTHFSYLFILTPATFFPGFAPDAWPMRGNQRTELRPTRALTITKVEYNRAIYGEN
jgi:hypothetical protein